MPKTIIIDPGHGGFDPGAVYGTRREKDDTLRLALAVGQDLENKGYRVVYTRKEDRYDSPYDKAQIANNSGGDLFISFHRNFAERPNLYQGVQALIYDKNPLALQVAKDVNQELEKVGFQNINIESRPELVVLRRTNMPAVLLEVGFVNSTVDNQIFDDKFSEMASAISMGIEKAFPVDTAKSEPRAQAIENTGNRDYMDNTDTMNGNYTTDNYNSMSNNRPMNSFDSMNNNGSMDNFGSMSNNGSMDNLGSMNNNASMDNFDSMNNNGSMDSYDSRANNNYSSIEQLQNDMRLSLNGIQCEYIPNQPKPPMPQMPQLWYYVQVGLFRYPENAVYLMEQLKQQGYSSVWKRVGGLIAIWVGPFKSLDEAVAMQQKLQNDGYETLIVTGDSSNK